MTKKLTAARKSGCPECGSGSRRLRSMGSASLFACDNADCRLEFLVNTTGLPGPLVNTTGLPGPLVNTTGLPGPAGACTSWGVERRPVEERKLGPRLVTSRDWQRPLWD